MMKFEPTLVTAELSDNEEVTVYNNYSRANKKEKQLLNIKDNLHRPICECEPNSTNEMTYLEFFCFGYAYIGDPLTADGMLKLMKESNETLNERLEELEWLMEK